MSPDPRDNATDVGRDRLIRVFRYLEALSQYRSPVKRLLSDQPWSMHLRDLPDHKAIQRSAVLSEEAVQDINAVILKVRRPQRTKAPAPPELIADWIEHGWEDLDGAARTRQSRNELDAEGRTDILRFEGDPRRPEVLARWQVLRDEWAANERPARDADLAYERLYALHGRLDREGGRLELILGDGLLAWRPPDGLEVHHPVLLQRVQLQFDPKVPEFSITDTGQGVKLNRALLQSLPGVDGGAVGKWNEELDQIDLQTIEGEAASGFLSGLVARLSSHGEFIEKSPLGAAGPEPQIGLDPVLFLRERAAGLTSALAQTAEAMSTRKDLPAHLLSIVGIHGVSNASVGPTGECDDILFSKPANAEQAQIVRRLDQHGAVLVQGPPGTGKSHTIANLIGHLLAQGKSVLVTSHTTKALRVLRGHIVEPLRPLCVSVLEGDIEGRRELEESVGAIEEHLAKDTDLLDKKAAELAGQRKSLLEERNRRRGELMRARDDEYREVVIAGKGYPPSEAARLVAEGRGCNDWISPALKPGDPLPLEPQELDDLYKLVRKIPAEDEAELRCWLPEPATLLSPDDFDGLVGQRTCLVGLDRTAGSEFWEVIPGIEARRLKDLSCRASRVMKNVDADKPWQLDAIDAGRLGGPHREPWDDLLAMIANACALAASARIHLMRHAPRLPAVPSFPDQKRIVAEILRHLEDRGKLRWLVLLIQRRWKTWIDGASVGGQRPHLLEHFRALAVLIDLTLCRNDLIVRWDRQMAALGAPGSDRLSPDQPEASCDQFTPQIRACLGWYASEWGPIEAELRELGFRWEALLAESPPKLANHGDLLRLTEAVRRLLHALAAWANAIQWQETDASLDRMARVLAPVGGETPTPVVEGLRQAIKANDPVAYREHYRRLVESHRLRDDLNRRDEQLARLGRTAPAWAAAIRDRCEPHNDGVVPGDAEAAWLWRQLNEELDRRGQTSLQEIQRKIERLDEELRRVTVKLIDHRAWACQVRRVTSNQRQSLIGWCDTVRKIGKAMGLRVPELRRQAACLMAECRGAVPVWIMPLSRVVENFDPPSTRFDVLIVDEASQSDAFALLALSMARKVVVVGDHEQVSPSAVGQNLTTVQSLIDTYLKGIPNAQLYDGRTSIYDLARQSFGGMICLTEHFRCVREIIAFSNHLSYNGGIRPLRDETLVPLRPHVVAYRVKDAAPVRGKVNRDEAAAVAALLVAATEDPAYDDKTFGVISLLGNDQALEVEWILRHRLEAAEYTRRRILCGSAAQFQGDERDVMFLSVVDTASGGPLPLRNQDDAKRRFNVAASRARDQMWVVHSLSPDDDLKPGDLRRRLIEHAENPLALTQRLANVGASVESEFERQVAQRLVRAGYRVHPQWKVGAYRIDLVVEGADKRLAIECDGDRFHPPEQLEADLVRQSILERLGWTFARIRGTQFFRDEEAAMGPVFKRLSELGIGPEPDPDSGRTPASGDTELGDRVIRRAYELLAEWSEEDQVAEDIESDESDGSVTTPPPDGQAEDHAQAIIAALRDTESPLGKSTILELADIPESRWTRVINLLKSTGRIVQFGNRGSTTYQLVNGKDEGG